MTEDTATIEPVTSSSSPADRRPRNRQKQVNSVAESFLDLQRTVRRSKARLAAAGVNDVESATQLILQTVATGGPMRASELALSVQSDLSTVSRQVTVLVGRGLLGRSADQLDGRASLLVVTAAGRAAIAEHEQGRAEFFYDVLSGWRVDELRQFAQQMRRFTSAYDETHAAWVSDRVVSSPRLGHHGTVGVQSLQEESHAP
jgi:DNA-binding MarR family transcriptional regulator